MKKTYNFTSWKNYSKFLLIFIFNICIVFPSFTTRIKDIVQLANVRENIFTGYGVVIGLPGTGDRRNNVTSKSISTYLAKQGIELDKNSLQLRNSAMVMVSARVTGFLSPGDKTIVQVASIGDARSITDGLLLPTSLRAANNQIYLTANGVVFTPENTPTRGVVTEGGMVEKEFALNNTSQLYEKNIISLKINNYFPDYSGTIKTSVQAAFPNYLVQIIGEKTLTIIKTDNNIFTTEEILDLLSYEVTLSPPAKIIIDINTGIVVMGDDVKINPVHISLPNISLTLGDAENARGGGNFTEAKTLMEELNKITASPQEITAIFSALKKSGAMNAELIMQ